MFEALEKPALRPLPSTYYGLATWGTARVHPDSHIVVAGALYSVPFVRIGKTVEVRVSEHRVLVISESVAVAGHSFIADGRSTLDSHLPEGREQQRHRSRFYGEQRAARIHPDLGRYLVEVCEFDDAVSQLRWVQAIVSHLERFPPSGQRAPVGTAATRTRPSKQSSAKPWLSMMPRASTPTTAIWRTHVSPAHRRTCANELNQ